MTRIKLPAIILAAFGASLLICAQSANPKPPTPKSQKELDAIQAMFTAQDPDGRIAAAMNLITKFADTEFKATAFYIAAFSAMQKNDLENVIVYCEKAIESDDKNYGSMILLASALAQRTREFDLDKEEKLGRSEKLARQAIELVKTAPKPNPQVTDEQWEAGKKDYIGQAHEALGMAAMVRKNYAGCAENLGLAVANSMQPDPATMVRLGNCLRMEKKYDEAIAILDKALADPQAASVVKQAATQEKIEANKAKAAAAPKQ